MNDNSLASYVNSFSQKPLPFHGCLLKIMYLCRIIQMTQKNQIKMEIWNG